MVLGPSFDIQERPLEDGRVLVALSGELDVVGAPRFVELVAERLRSASVVVDLAGLTFMDSSGVRALNTLLGTADASPGQLSVRDRFDDAVAQLLQMTGMLETLPLEPAR